MVKNDILEELDKLKFEVGKTKENISDLLRQIEEKNIFAKQTQTDNRQEWFKFICEHMAAGLTFRQSLTLLCGKYGLDEWETTKLFRCWHAEHKAIKIYAKVYAVRKLRLAGFTAEKIADILNISRATVYRLSNCGLNLE